MLSIYPKENHKWMLWWCYWWKTRRYSIFERYHKIDSECFSQYLSFWTWHGQNLCHRHVEWCLHDSSCSVWNERFDCTCRSCSWSFVGKESDRNLWEHVVTWPVQLRTWTMSTNLVLQYSNTEDIIVPYNASTDFGLPSANDSTIQRWIQIDDFTN